MICDACGQEMYDIYIDGEHQKICDNCYIPGEEDSLVDEWKIFPDIEYIKREEDNYGEMEFI